MSRTKKNDRGNRQDRRNFLIKICATTGLLFLLPLIAILLAVSTLLYQSYQDTDSQLAVVVTDTEKGNVSVEFLLKGVRHQQQLFSSQQNLKKGDEIKVWITNDDPTTIQQTKPTHEIRSVYWYLLVIMTIAIVVNVLLYVYVPSVVCFLFLLNVVLFVIAAIRAGSKK